MPRRIRVFALAGAGVVDPGPLWCRRQVNTDRRAVAWVTVDLQPPAMGADGPMDDPQAESGAIRVGRLQKLPAQIADGRTVHTDAVVCHGQPNEWPVGIIRASHAGHANL